ncbi:glutamyl aminopeptidase-like [Odontomachus brunneus]|uniref:glutamyl aminopeptidase-like n=1 Tax=Odontomachus brunneus TaxID=486640 RepID=UPI0013F26A67|nr:glutamyl aminopeptidase-like [Odontomachus brunneus]
MKTICLNLILSIVLIFTVVRANVSDSIITDTDVGDCTFASPEDRLPFDIMKPKSYDIIFIIGYIPHFASSRILIEIYQQTRTIRLHAHNIKRIKLNDIHLTNAAKCCFKESEIRFPVRYRYCKISQMLDLHFKHVILPGFYYLTLNFAVPITINVYKNDIRHVAFNLAKHERWSYTYSFKSIGARRIFPCWDQSEIRATFNISVVHPKKYKVFSNMPLQLIWPRSGEILHSYFMPSYMLTVSEVTIVVTDNNIIRHFDFMTDSIWCYPESPKNLSFAFSTVVEVKMSLANYATLSILPEIQHIMIPSPLKVVGSPGLIIYRERDVSYLEGSDFVGVKINVAQLIASQIARQWFRRNITHPTPIEFIRESFATYFSYFFSLQFDMSIQLEELFVVQIVQSAFHCDITLRMNSIASDVYDIMHSNEIDRILYIRYYHNKGAVFLRMLQQILSPQKFRERIGQYLKNSDNLVTITGNDLWKTLQGTDDVQQEGNPHIKDLMHGWLRQKHYPELYITFDDNNVNITTFCESSTNCDIPISILVQSDNSSYFDTLPLTWMMCNESKIISKSKESYFFIYNLRQVGYYRVNYANSNWQLISNYLTYSGYTNIPVQNRAQLIDDAYYFTMAGKLSTSIFLNLIEYLKRETHYVAWYPMFNILTYMSAYWKLSASSSVKATMLEILDNLLTNIGYEEKPEDNGMTKTLRLLATKWSCKLGHSECRKAASAKLETKYNSPDTQILPWWKEWVYCTGMMQLNENTWQQILRESLRSSDISTFKYLACTDNFTRITYYIDLLLDKEIAELIENKQLTEHFQSTLKRYMQNDMVYPYVLERFMKIIDRFYKHEVIVLWGDIIWNLRFEDELKKIEEFLIKVETRYSPGSYKVLKIIRARKDELNKIHKMFYNF